jgi:hypothetical protein
MRSMRWLSASLNLALAIALVALAPLVATTHPAQDNRTLTFAQFWRCNQAPVAACAGPELSFETTDFVGDRCPAALRECTATASCVGVHATGRACRSMVCNSTAPRRGHCVHVRRMDLPNPCGTPAPGRICDGVCCEIWSMRREFSAFSDAALECCKPSEPAALRASMAGSQPEDTLSRSPHPRCSARSSQPQSDAHERVAELNRRWVKHGVTMHGFDGTTARPRTLAQFLRGHLGSQVVSTSLVSWRLPFFFKGFSNNKRLDTAKLPATGHAGLIVAEAAVRRGLLCSYHTNGGSALVAQRSCAGWSPNASQTRSRCVPGCVGLLWDNGGLGRTSKAEGLRTWCDNATRPSPTGMQTLRQTERAVAELLNLCAERPERLGVSLASHALRVGALSDYCTEKNVAWSSTPFRERFRDPLCRCLDRNSSQCCKFPNCPLCTSTADRTWDLHNYASASHPALD